MPNTEQELGLQDQFTLTLHLECEKHLEKGLDHQQPILEPVKLKTPLFHLPREPKSLPIHTPT